MKTEKIRRFVGGMLIGCMLNTVATGQSIYKYVKLRVSGLGYSDETVIRFVPDAKTGYDGYDAIKLPNGSPNPNLSTFVGSFNIVINSLPLLEYDMEIPTCLRVGVSGQYMIEIADVFAAPSGADIALEDKVTGIWTNMREANNYYFTINDTTYKPRFVLHLFQESRVTTSNVSCYGADDGIIQAKGAGKGPWNYNWTTLDGDTLRSIINKASADTLRNVPPGEYAVSINDNSGLFASVTSAVLVTGPQSILASTSKNDVSCKNGNDGFIELDVYGGTSPYQILWSTGDTANDIYDLTEGEYYLYIKDKHGCVYNESIIIYEHDSIIANFMTGSDTAYLSNGGVVYFTNTSSGGTSGYIWDFGDGASQESGAEVSHAYISAGVYTVTLVASNGICSGTAIREITVLGGPLTVKGYEKQSVVIKVNMHTGWLAITIITEETIKGMVTLTDISGRVIYNIEKVWQNGESTLEIPVSILSQGVFLIQFSSERNTQKRKILLMP